MSKRPETIAIEERLYHMVQKKRVYGCSEVTIGFYGKGHGNEIVDFCTMDSKGIVRCYEIKISFSDLKSKAKKSWYGHYNYLLVGEELLSRLEDVAQYIPEYVGIAIPCFDSWSDGIKIIRNARKQSLSDEDEVLIKESLVRTLSNKLNAVRDANNLKKMSELESNLRKKDQELKDIRTQYDELQFSTQQFERYLRRYYGLDFSLDDFHKTFGAREQYLPQTISLTLTERGLKYNKQVEQNNEED